MGRVKNIERLFDRVNSSGRSRPRVHASNIHQAGSLILRRAASRGIEHKLSISLRVAVASALLGGGAVLGRLSDLLATLVLARVLFPADFGLVALAMTGLQFAMIATELPIISALIQKRAIDAVDVDTAFTLAFLRGIVVAMLLYVVGLALASGLKDERILPIAMVLSLAPIAGGLQSPALVHQQRKLHYAPTAASVVVGKLLSLVLTVMLAWTTRSYWALVLLQVATPICTAIITYIVAPYRPRFSLARSRELFGFVGWLSLSNIVIALNQQSDRLLIGTTLSRGQFGNYTMGSDISSTSTYALVGPLMQTLFSGLASIASSEQPDARDRLRLAYLKGQQTLVAAMLPIGVGLAAIADPFVNVVFNSAWAPVAFVVKWIAPVIGLQMLTVVVHSAALATGRTRVILVRELAALLVRLPPVLVAALMFGFTGAVIARSLTGLVVIAINLSIGAQLVGTTLTRQLVNCWRSFASALAMASTVLAAQVIWAAGEAEWGPFGLAVLVILGGLTYVLTHIGLWVVCGRPGGAESFAIDLVRSAVNRVQKRAA